MRSRGENEGERERPRKRGYMMREGGVMPEGMQRGSGCASSPRVWRLTIKLLAQLGYTLAEMLAPMRWPEAELRAHRERTSLWRNFTQDSVIDIRYLTRGNDRRVNMINLS